MVETIHLDDEGDRWRWVCPAGHRNWEPTNHHFWCQTCADSVDPEADPEFDHLHDLKNGREVHREAVRLVTEFGEYTDLRRSRA